MTSGKRTPETEAGLTLLEVLAAVMIFAMVMTVVIGTSTSAVHHVGLSSRKLEADLFADNLLADLEIQINQGVTPVIDENEFTQDQFSVHITQTQIFPEDPGRAAGPASGLAGIAAAAGGDVLSTLGTALPEVAGHLMQYDIEVSWLEQNGPQSVTRTTFAFDWQAAETELAAFVQDNPNGVSGLGANDDKTGSGSGKGGGKRQPGFAPIHNRCRGHNAGDCQRAGRAGQGRQQ